MNRFIQLRLLLLVGLLPLGTAGFSGAVQADSSVEPFAEAKAIAEKTLAVPVDACTRSLTAFLNPFQKISPAQRLTDFKKFMGLAFPVQQSIQSWKDKDKRFFMFFEQPAIGLLTTPLATVAAKLAEFGLASSLSFFTGHTPQLPSFLTWGFLRNSAEAWAGFNATNIPRYSIGLDKSLNATQKKYIAWWLSGVSYALLSTGDKLTKMETTEDLVYALSLISYAFIWPVYSQYMANQVVVPHLFGRFLNDTELKKAYSQTQISAADSAAAAIQGEPDPSVTVELPRKELLKSKADALTSSQKNLNTVTKAIQELEIVGNSLNPDERSTLLQRLKKSLPTLKRNVAKAQDNVKWVKLLTEGLKDHEAVPRSRKAHYWARKTATSSAFAVFMVSTYFLSRWVVAGDAPGQNVPLQAFYRTVTPVLAEAWAGEKDPGTEFLQRMHPVLKRQFQDLRDLKKSQEAQAKDLNAIRDLGKAAEQYLQGETSEKPLDADAEARLHEISTDLAEVFGMRD